MFCGKCGAPIIDGARHCSRCGAPFKMRPRRSEIELTPPYPKEAPYPVHNSKGTVRNMGNNNKGGDDFFAPPDL